MVLTLHYGKRKMKVEVNDRANISLKHYSRETKPSAVTLR